MQFHGEVCSSVLSENRHVGQTVSCSSHSLRQALSQHSRGREITIPMNSVYTVTIYKVCVRVEDVSTGESPGGCHGFPANGAD
ncbi:hypothetical protein GBAR_LOCUS1263, partial [Geodia barretti]